MGNETEPATERPEEEQGLESVHPPHEPEGDQAATEPVIQVENSSGDSADQMILESLKELEGWSGQAELPKAEAPEEPPSDPEAAAAPAEDSPPSVETVPAPPPRKKRKKITKAELQQRYEDQEAELNRATTRLQLLLNERDKLRRGRDKLHQEKDETYQRLLRVSADLDNLRKRTRREKKDAGDFGRREVVRLLLPVLDAMEAGRRSAASSQNGGDAAFSEGAELIFASLEKAVYDAGLRPLVPTGEIFDPTQHEAVHVIKTEEVPDSTVLEVGRTGYLLDEFVLRAAMVIVAKGGPPADKEPSEEPEESPEDGAEEESSDEIPQAAVDASAEKESKE